jgi:Phosphotransferase enzyme family
MAVTIQEELPGGTTPERLRQELARSLARPDLQVDDVTCAPVAHAITAPSTGSLTRVVVRAHDREPVELRLVAKCLQSAIHGLPPFVPLADRERIAAGIPWRLEAEVYTAGTAELMPPELRLPRLFGAVEHPDDRITLWLEDVDPVDEPWSAADLARAATGLGRLTVRRSEQVLRTLPAGAFLPYMVENALHQWALPVLRDDDVWAHRAFAQPSVAALREDLLALADDVDTLLDSLSGVPWPNTHGDPTPMNMLRPRSAPEEFVLIDWGTASRGPVGWDVVPLVFGPAENGSAPPDDLAERLAIAVPAFEAGLAAEGMALADGAVAASVRACALLRYPFTSLPLSEATVGRPERDDLPGYARRKAAFVQAVLDACR